MKSFNQKSEMKKIAKYLPTFLLAFVLASCDQHPVSSVTIDRNTLELQVGETYQLEAVILPLEASMYNSVSWASSNEAVATVSSDGTVTAVYTGSCTITATAGKKSTTCSVTVGKLDYEFSFSRATVLYYGDAYECGTNNLVLRLLGDGISLSDEGALSGEGIFFNIDMNVPLGNRTVPVHTFELDSSRTEYTFAAGELQTIDGAQYATGTFVGQRTADGLTVVFVQSGSFWVTLDGDEYTLEGHFEGKNQETIVVSFSGKIDFLDRSGETPAEIYTFATQQLTQDFLGDVSGKSLNQFQYTAVDADTTLVFTLYAPLSVKEKCPAGTYDFSGARSYSIVSAMFNVGTAAYAINNGEVDISEIDGKQIFSCQFVDEAGRTIIGEFSEIVND